MKNLKVFAVIAVSLVAFTGCFEKKADEAKPAETKAAVEAPAPEAAAPAEPATK